VQNFKHPAPTVPNALHLVGRCDHCRHHIIICTVVEYGSQADEAGDHFRDGKQEEAGGGKCAQLLSSHRMTVCKSRILQQQAVTMIISNDLHQVRWTYYASRSYRRAQGLLQRSYNCAVASRLCTSWVLCLTLYPTSAYLAIDRSYQYWVTHFLSSSRHRRWIYQSYKGSPNRSPLRSANWRRLMWADL
jgi:hypothetical protein